MLEANRDTLSNLAVWGFSFLQAHIPPPREKGEGGKSKPMVMARWCFLPSISSQKLQPFEIKRRYNMGGGGLVAGQNLGFLLSPKPNKKYGERVWRK